jgi:hypothetical protein
MGPIWNEAALTYRLEQINGKGVDWMEQVSEEQYHQPHRNLARFA